LHRPRCMLAHEGVGIVIASALQRRHGGGLPAIAERDAYVAQESAALGAQDRTACEELSEALLVQLEEALQRPVIQRARLKARFARLRREAVPGTHLLADVAAEDPVADRGPHLERDRAAMLDGPVRDAEPRVELIGRDDGSDRTRAAATRAADAVIAVRRR